MNRRDKDIFRRGRTIRGGQPGKGPVLYYMSREMRSSASWPLLFALQEAAVAERPLLVISCFDPKGYEVTARNVSFLKAGFIQAKKGLKNKNIGFELHRGKPFEIIPQLLYTYDIHSLVLDFDPLEHSRNLLKTLKKIGRITIHEVDGHNIIPAWTASQKKEYGAYTLRPKIRSLLPDYLTEYPEVARQASLWLPQFPAETKIAPEDIIPELYNSDAPVVELFSPGQQAAEKLAEQFCSGSLPFYHQHRNDPCNRCQSELSPYFHFGHISSQQVALMIQEAAAPQDAKDAFLEEMIVRKELSDNYCLYEPNYHNFNGFHEWAQKTLDEHRKDRREFTYSFEEFNNAKTHEVLWNACQTELKGTGKLHGYLRMYWAKKILEWSPSPEEAQQTAITLNDRYGLDGRDPNGYTGIAWSIGGIHDRAWQQRPVFGKIRYMNISGCRRKFDVNRYITDILSSYSDSAPDIPVGRSIKDSTSQIEEHAKKKFEPDENIMESALVYKRWQQVLRRHNAGALVSFHTRHKFLLQAHNEQLYREMGMITAGAGKTGLSERLEKYQLLLLQAMQTQPTVKTHVNVLMHLMGFFKKKLKADEKQELLGTIDQFKASRIPLTAPITLLNHYVRKYNHSYLLQQYYLNPPRLEPKLINHP